MYEEIKRVNSLEYIGSIIEADGDRTTSYGGWQ